METQNKFNLKLGTWNLRTTLLRPSRMNQIAEEISETRLSTEIIKIRSHLILPPLDRGGKNS